MTNTATVLALMVGLAVGIDYALFIVSRHREQLADPEQDVRGLDRPGRRHRGQRGDLRRRHGHRRARRAVRHRYPLPDHHGPGRGGHRADRGAGRPHPGAGRAGLRRRTAAAHGAAGGRYSAGPERRCTREPRQPGTWGLAWARGDARPGRRAAGRRRRPARPRPARPASAARACPATRPSRSAAPSTAATNCSPRASVPASTPPSSSWSTRTASRPAERARRSSRYWAPRSANDPGVATVAPPTAIAGRDHHGARRRTQDRPRRPGHHRPGEPAARRRSSRR